MIQAIEKCTSQLKDTPYDPSPWTERAGYFLALGYPELAAGDAYKAGLLFERTSTDVHHVQEDARDGPPEYNKDRIRQERLRAYGILGQALYDCHCHLEAAAFWEELSKKVPGEYAKNRAAELRSLLKKKKEAAAELPGTPQEQRDRLRDGGVVTVHYPWMEERHMTRSSETIDMVNTELRSIEPQSCYWAPSTLTEKKDMLGMFASRDIQPGELILIDRTATGTCSNGEGFVCGNCYGRVKCPPIQSSCCSNISDDSAHAAHAAVKFSSKLLVYCSTSCYDLAMSTYHKVLCGQDFNWLVEPAKGLEVNASPLRPLLMLRFLASCIQSGTDASPLDHPLLRRLQPLANCDHVDVFTFDESIVAPIKILEQLGVDVFANLNYDTMVLHSIWTRIANNKVGSPDPKRGFIDEISPLLPLFNHSCDPNVEQKREDSSTTIRFFAKRFIAKDEEMFNSYLNVDGVNLEERVERLMPWFEEPCLCPKCKRERQQRTGPF
jgi:hypothetical protein